MPRNEQLELDIPRFAVNRLQRIPLNQIIDISAFTNDPDTTESISASGILEPIKVERLTSGAFRVLDGRRRAAAFRVLAINEIPAMVYGPLSAIARAAITLTSNIARHGNPATELDAYMELTRQNLTLQDISTLLRIPTGKLRVYSRLSNLNPDAIKALRNGRMGTTVGLQMVRHMTDDQQREVCMTPGVITLSTIAPFLPDSGVVADELQTTITLPSTALNVTPEVQKTTDEEGRTHWFIHGTEYVPINTAQIVVEEVSVASMTMRETWEGTLRLLEAAYAGMPVAPDDDSEDYYGQLRTAIDSARAIARRRSGRYAVPS